MLGTSHHAPQIPQGMSSIVCRPPMTFEPNPELDSSQLMSRTKYYGETLFLRSWMHLCSHVANSTFHREPSIICWRWRWWQESRQAGMILQTVQAWMPWIFSILSTLFPSPCLSIALDVQKLQPPVSSLAAYDLLFQRHPDVTHLRLLSYRFMQRLQASASRNEELENVWRRPEVPRPLYDQVKYLVR